MSHLVNPLWQIQHVYIDTPNTSPQLPKEIIFLDGLRGNGMLENPDIRFSEGNIYGQWNMI
jgi:hypothetical protein